MWEPYVQSTLSHVPGAASKIVHDPFHLVKYMNEAVNEVRKSEHRRLQAQGGDILKSTRQLWLYGMENVPASTPNVSMRSRKSICKPRGLGCSKRCSAVFGYALDSKPPNGLSRNGMAGPGAPGQYPGLFCASLNQWSHRGSEQQNPGANQKSIWLSEQRTVQERHLLQSG
jgi:hypothetical protein